MAHLSGYHIRIFSTLEFEKDDNVMITGIDFRLGNKEHSLSTERLNEILGCFTDGYYNHPHFSRALMWRLIVRMEHEHLNNYLSGRSKTTVICNPVSGYLQ